MGKGRDLLQRLTDQTEFGAQPLPGQPIIEIAGERRVLIENHQGVKEYSRERITVKVHFGCVSICGCQLELIQMTRERLVICGRIEEISLIRRLQP